jgi:hypothetical protein
MSVERGIGYASVIPAAFIGTAGLADYAGPTGWRGFSEFLGWAVVCLGAGLGVGSVFKRVRHPGVRRYLAILLAAVAVAVFTYLTYWVGLDAPMLAKAAFTRSLQIVGSLAPVALVITSVVIGVRQRY